jgi:hypothetical protein
MNRLPASSENIGREIDACLRRVDCGDHMRIGFVAAVQDRDNLAGADRFAGNSADRHLEPFGRVVGRDVELDPCVALPAGAHQPTGAPLDAADAEPEIKQCA